MQGGDEGAGGSDYKDVENKYDFSCRRISFALWRVFGNVFLKMGAALRNALAPECFLFVFPSNPQMLCVYRAEEQSGREGLYGQTGSCARTALCLSLIHI